MARSRRANQHMYKTALHPAGQQESKFQHSHRSNAPSPCFYTPSPPSNGGSFISWFPRPPLATDSPPITVPHRPSQARQDPNQRPPRVHHWGIQRHRPGPGASGRKRRGPGLHPGTVRRKTRRSETIDPARHRNRGGHIFRGR